MASPVQPVRGTRDIIGAEAVRHHHIIQTARRLSALYGFSEWQTPIFEDTKIFSRTLGETSDVVTKEMYTFLDRGNDLITLRPEGTAGICRALISNGLTQTLPQKVFYAGPMFRYERPQKGRYRQFHQIGIEMLGPSASLADAEVIACGWRLLQELGISNEVVLNINTLGDAGSRDNYRSALVGYFTTHESDLSEDSKNRLEKNPLRILDSKDEGDKELCANAPLIYDYLSDDAEAHYSNLQRYLREFDVPFKQNPRIVRGLDYYNHTAFEFVTTALGAQGTVLAGGRYNGLIEQMGGPNIPGVGWAAGTDRLALLLKSISLDILPVAIVLDDSLTEKFALTLLKSLRAAGIAAELPFQGNSNKRLEHVKKSGARLAVLANQKYLEKNKIAILDLEALKSKNTELDVTDYRLFISIDEVVPKLKELLSSFAKDGSFIKFNDRLLITT